MKYNHKNIYKESVLKSKENPSNLGRLNKMNENPSEELF